MRYQRQVHEVLTPVEAEGQLTEDDLEDVLDRFNDLYEQRYGEGSVFKQGVTEMVEFRVRAVGNLSTPALHEESPTDSTIAGARIGEKEMYFEAADGLAETPVYDFTDMSPGDGFDGPGVILTPVTTIVVNPGDRARMDRYRNVRLDVEGGSQ
jgi:N-methylhydantoinase A